MDLFQLAGVWTSSSHPQRRASLWRLSWQSLSLPCGWHVGHQKSSAHHPARLGPFWGGRGGRRRDLLLTQEQKEAVSFTALCGFPLCAGTAVAPTSSISNVSCLHSSPAVQACLYQEQVPNRDMEFSRQASGTAAAKATVVGLGNNY